MLRREFVKLSGGFALTGAISTFDLGRSLPGSIHFGLCADVHKDLVPDADRRLREFIDEANRRKPDFVVQLGDFCTPKKENLPFLDIFNSFRGPVYHVIGNHDMDGGFAKPDTVKYYGMPERYYSFERGKFHFVVLDGTVGEYPWTLDEEQLNWLKNDLDKASLPVVLFVHQPLETLEKEPVSNVEEVRAILESPEFKGKRKVIASFQGHRHMDYMKTVNAIPYFQINSMSYFWMGSRYARKMADENLDKKFPAMKYCTRYKDSLYCFIKISRSGIVSIEGRSSVFIDGTPQERGYVFQNITPDQVTASITKRVYSVG